MGDRWWTPLVLESVIFTGNSLRFQTTLKAILSEGYIRLNSFFMDGKLTDLITLWLAFQNYKRVAEVWMDEYKEYLYLRRPQYRNLEVGDLSAQYEIRERLQCKPFKWFMKNIAFDLPKKYPPIEPPDFASGEVRFVETFPRFLF